MIKILGLFILSLFLISACSNQIANETPDIEGLNIPTLIPTLENYPIKTEETALAQDISQTTATVEALVNKCQTTRHYPSPNGKWLAITCDDYEINASDEGSTTLKFVNLETLQEWVVSYYQLYGKREIESLGELTDGTIYTLNWSYAGDQVYIGIMPQVHREYYYNRIAALFVLNLGTGEITEVLDTDTIQETFYDYSLSHDERKIVFVKLLEKPLQIKSKNLDTNKIQSVQLNSKFSFAGSMVWSQTDDSVIFLAVNFNSNKALSTLYKWNIQAGELVELFQLPDMLGRLFLIVKWDDVNNIVVIRNYHADELFNVNLSTGEISPASP
jgi:hypothetical protein